ncbi:MAG: DUF6624 domain-containing protein [Patescibacteria group bacterium]
MITNDKLKGIKKEIVERAKRDQEMRRRWGESGFKPNIYNKKIDKENTRYLKSVVERYGWPSSRQFGKKVVKSAWLIVQHAGHDKTFQWNVLRLLKRQVNSAITPKLIATLEDRLLVADGRKQKYGTQFHIDLKSFSISVPPIANKKKLNMLRKQIGLRPFEEQLKRVTSSVAKMRKK